MVTRGEQDILMIHASMSSNDKSSYKLSYDNIASFDTPGTYDTYLYNDDICLYNDDTCFYELR